MPSITDTFNTPAKILLIGKSGAGKTGALASLVAAGYNLRIIDTDKGVLPLRSLLTDPHYAYSRIIAAEKINLSTAVRYIPIDTAMKLRGITRTLPNKSQTVEQLLAPTDAKAWPKVLGLLDKWKEDDLDLGPIYSWTTNDVLVIDSFSTLARCVYYFSQALNGRLGARDSGYDYQRDIGEAQSQLTRFLELLYATTVPCNVIVISHITWVDDSQGVAQRPQLTDKEGNTVFSSPDGYPSAIGRALSPQMGKYFNDLYVVKAEGSGDRVRRTISTVPTDGVIAKNSVHLDREYPVAHGLATIFSALRAKPLSSSFTEAFRGQKSTPQLASASVTQRPPASAVTT